jgi:hypothetical protein
MRITLASGAIIKSNIQATVKQQQHNSSPFLYSTLLFHTIKMPFGYQCSKCGDAHKEEIVHDVVVKIANVYVKGVYDECGGVEIQVESNASTYCSSILAYPMQFAPDLGKWNIPHDSLLATEIYCNGKVHQEPTRQLQMYLLKQKQQSRYCVPPHVRIQDALHVWHLASLPKALPSNNKNTHTAATSSPLSSSNIMNIPKKASSIKTKQEQEIEYQDVHVPDVW